MAAGPICVNLVAGTACVGVNAGTSVGGEVFVLVSPRVAPSDWRSAHVDAGPGGAGAAVHGHGLATGGALDVWAGLWGMTPGAGAYFCVGVPHYLPPSCGDALYQARRVATLVP